MDTDLAEHLIDLKEGIARIEERTQNIYESQKELKKALITHEERDRVDFEKIHGRINRNDRKLNFLMGGVALASFLIIAGAAIVNAL